jgi:hypothetical protein
VALTARRSTGPRRDGKAAAGELLFQAGDTTYKAVIGGGNSAGQTAVWPGSSCRYERAMSTGQSACCSSLVPTLPSSTPS